MVCIIVISPMLSSLLRCLEVDEEALVRQYMLSTCDLTTVVLSFTFSDVLNHVGYNQIIEIDGTKNDVVKLRMVLENFYSASKPQACYDQCDECLDSAISGCRRVIAHRFTTRKADVKCEIAWYRHTYYQEEDSMANSTNPRRPILYRLA